MSVLSRTTVGGCTYDALCKGAINYACDRSCLVDLAFIAQRQCPIQMLAQKLEENLQGLEIERDGRVTQFYIGKAYVMQKKKRGGGFQRFDAMDPNTWRQNGISSRWRRHKLKGRHGLIVLTVVTRYTTPDDLSQQVYATTLQQKLIEYYKKDPRFEDENYRGDGRRQTRQMFYGYALYVAFIIDENHDMAGSDDGCAGVPFNIIDYESPTRYCISNSAQSVSSRYVNSEENGKKIDAQKCSDPQKRVRFQDGLCSEGHSNELLHRTYASPHGCTSTNFNHRFMVFQMSCPSQSNTPSSTINLYSTPDASRENTKVKRISLAANPKTLKSLHNNSTLPPPHKIPHVSSSVEELVPFNIAPSLPPLPPLLPTLPPPTSSLPSCPRPLPTPPPPTSSLPSRPLPTLPPPTSSLPSCPRPLPTPPPPTSSLPSRPLPTLPPPTSSLPSCPRPLPTLPPSTSSLLPPRPRPCPPFFPPPPPPPPPPHRLPPPTSPFLPSRPRSHPPLSPPRPCLPLTSSLPPSLSPSLPPPPILLPSRPLPPHHHRPPPPTPPPTPPTPSPPAMFTDATSFSAATAVRVSQFVQPANRPRHISVIVSLGK